MAGSVVGIMGRRLEPQEALGRVVRELRAERGMTQRQLGEAADVNETWVSHIEAGRTNPAWGTVDRLARALGVSITEIARRTDQLADES